MKGGRVCLEDNVKNDDLERIYRINEIRDHEYFHS